MTDGFVSIIARKIHIFDYNLLFLVNAANVPCSNKVNFTVESNSSFTLELKWQIDSAFNMFYEGINVIFRHTHCDINDFISLINELSTQRRMLIVGDFNLDQMLPEHVAKVNPLIQKFNLSQHSQYLIFKPYTWRNIRFGI